MSKGEFDKKTAETLEEIYVDGVLNFEEHQILF